MASFTSPIRNFRTLAISNAEDDLEIRTKYRPFLLDAEVEASDWIAQLKLDTAITMADENISKTGSRLKVLVLYGSLRKRYESCPWNLYWPNVYIQDPTRNSWSLRRPAFFTVLAAMSAFSTLANYLSVTLLMLRTLQCRNYATYHSGQMGTFGAHLSNTEISLEFSKTK